MDINEEKLRGYSASDLEVMKKYAEGMRDHTHKYVDDNDSSARGREREQRAINWNLIHDNLDYAIQRKIHDLFDIDPMRETL